MADVQLENGYIKISNELFDQFFVRDFSPIQLRILLLIIRVSYGCNKKTAIIKPQNSFNCAYIYDSDIRRELKYLEKNKVIYCDYENRSFVLNKDYDEWKIPYHKLYDEEKFAKLLHINLSAELRKNLVENKDFEESLLTTKNDISGEQRQKLVDNKDLLPENADIEQERKVPKYSIKESIKSLSHDIDEKERENIFEILKKNKKIENPLAYLRKIISNGDYKIFLKEYQNDKNISAPNLQEIVKKATDKRTAAIIICKYGNGANFNIQAQPTEIQSIMRKYKFEDWNDAYDYLMNIDKGEF